MKKERSKFQRYPLKGHIVKRSSLYQSAPQSARLRALCGCGSGRIFKKCCYRSDHRIFNLTRYIEKLKNVKLKMNDLVFRRFLDEYIQVPEIQEATDKLSDQLYLPTFQQVINEVKQGTTSYDTPEQVIASTVQFEALSIDYILHGHKKPIFQEYLQFRQYLQGF